jgi:hypothetical protein
VLTGVEPLVMLAACAIGGMAACDPFKTGNMAFPLRPAKALMPFVFVFSPLLLPGLISIRASSAVAVPVLLRPWASSCQAAIHAEGGPRQPPTKRATSSPSTSIAGARRANWSANTRAEPQARAQPLEP